MWRPWTQKHKFSEKRDIRKSGPGKYESPEKRDIWEIPWNWEIHGVLGKLGIRKKRWAWNLGKAGHSKNRSHIRGHISAQLRNHSENPFQTHMKTNIQNHIQTHSQIHIQCLKTIWIHMESGAWASKLYEVTWNLNPGIQNHMNSYGIWAYGLEAMWIHVGS